MKKFSVLIVVLLLIMSCNNDLKREVKRYSNGRIKTIQYLNKKENLEGKAFDFYENGNMKSIFNYQNEKIVGYVTLFRESGTLQTRLKIRNKLVVDTLFNYRKESKLLRNKVIYGNKQDTLKMVWYYPNGKLKKEKIYIENYKNNIDEFINPHIQYLPNGKIDYDNSNFVKIDYLNKEGNKIRFTINRSKDYNIYEYSKQIGLEVFILKPQGAKEKLIRERLIRQLTLPNSKSCIITFTNEDYINNTLNILVARVLVNDGNSKSLLYNDYNIQLIKGDISRWHNVHVIVKEGNKSLLQ